MALRTFGSLVLSKFLPRRICNQAVGPARDGTPLVHGFLNQLDEKAISIFLNAIKLSGHKTGDILVEESKSIECHLVFARTQDIHLKGETLCASHMTAVTMLSTTPGVLLAKKNAESLERQIVMKERSSGKQYMLSNVLNVIQTKRPLGSFNRTFHSCRMIGSKDPLPDRVDWTAMGGVTSVKNQGWGETCWVFGPVASVEFVHYSKTGVLESLSVQQVIDCNPYGRLCKGGGYVEETLTYVMNHGLTTWSRYPYVGLDGTCKYTIEQKVATISGYYYPESGEEGLQRAVVLQPVPVSIFCKSNVFQGYKGGIISSSSAWEGESKEPDHIVLLTGYDTDEKGNKFWKIKNSWGEALAGAMEGTASWRGVATILVVLVASFVNRYASLSPDHT